MVKKLNTYASARSAVALGVSFLEDCPVFNVGHSAAPSNADAGMEMGTIGAIMLDCLGQLATGRLTGRSTMKQNGSSGDAAVLGSGIYLDTDTKPSVLWCVLQEI